MVLNACSYSFVELSTTCSVLELDGNEAAVSLCLLRFSNWPEEGMVLAVGTVQGLAFYPRTADGTHYGWLPTFC